MDDPRDHLEVFAPTGMLGQWLTWAAHAALCEQPTSAGKIAVVWASGAPQRDLACFAEQLASRDFTGLVVVLSSDAGELCDKCRELRLALGLLSSHSNEDRLTDAIRAVARAHSYVDPRLDSRTRRPTPSFTARERQVLHRLGRATNSEIARELGIGVESVKTHVRSILRKTGKRGRYEAFQAARNRDVI